MATTYPANSVAPGGGLSSPLSSGAGVLDREAQEQLVEPGDQDRFSHYAPKNKIMESMVTGTPLIALCGKVWIPSRDPEKFPVCPKCKEIYSTMPGGGKDDKK